MQNINQQSLNKLNNSSINYIENNKKKKNQSNSMQSRVSTHRTENRSVDGLTFR